jgi:DNA-binding response OmpR family regulator
VKRILFVDRDLKTVEQLRDPLEAHGFDVEIALSGEIGLQILEQRRVDVILLSLAANEEENPIQLVDTLRRDHPGIPVVLVTEGVETSRIEVALGDALKVSHRKPLSLDALLADIVKTCS